MVAARNNAVGWKYEDGASYYAEKARQEANRPGGKPILNAESIKSK